MSFRERAFHHLHASALRFRSKPARVAVNPSHLCAWSDFRP